MVIQGDTHTRADHPFAFASRMLAAFWVEVANFDQWWERTLRCKSYFPTLPQAFRLWPADR